MPHISKYKLKESTLININKELLSALQNEDTATELLTSTEKIMLAKRLVTIYLLRSGYTYYEIMKLLKISTSTIKRIEQSIWKGKYERIVQEWEKPKVRKNILDLVDSLVTAGGTLPRYSKISKPWLPYTEWKKMNQLKLRRQATDRIGH